jgi:hypothetical protein
MDLLVDFIDFAISVMTIPFAVISILLSMTIIAYIGMAVTAALGCCFGAAWHLNLYRHVPVLRTLEQKMSDFGRMWSYKDLESGETLLINTVCIVTTTSLLFLLRDTLILELIFNLFTSGVDTLTGLQLNLHLIVGLAVVGYMSAMDYHYRNGRTFVRCAEYMQFAIAQRRFR